MCLSLRDPHAMTPASCGGTLKDMNHFAYRIICLQEGTTSKDATPH